jgi:hypothetical protein
MSSNQKIRHLSNCSIANTAPDSRVIIAVGVDEVSLRKRKEEASKTLYIARI